MARESSSPRAPFTLPTPSLAFQTPSERDLATNWRLAIVPFVKALHFPQPHPSHHWDQQGWPQRGGRYHRASHSQQSCLESGLGPLKLGLCFGPGRKTRSRFVPASLPSLGDKWGHKESHSGTRDTRFCHPISSFPLFLLVPRRQRRLSFCVNPICRTIENVYKSFNQ